MSRYVRPTVHSRAGLAGLVAFGLLSALALLLAKWWPYADRTVSLVGSGSWEGGSLLESKAVGPGLLAGWEFLLSYGGAVWQALVAAVLVGAAVEAFVPRDWLARSLQRWGPFGGGLLALPSMMCTCCAAPIVSSMRRGGAGIGPSVAYWLGNPVLNPAVLGFLLLVGPWQWAATRLVVGVGLVLGVSMLAARFAAPASGGQPSLPVPTAEPGSARRFVRSLVRFALVLVPEYAVLVFAVGALRGWLFPLDGGVADATAVAAVVAAVLGLLLVIPTAGEIPVMLALAAAGISPFVLGILLISLPAVSLPSMLLVARALTWRTTGLVVAGVAVAALLAGAVLAGLSTTGGTVSPAVP